MTGVSGSFGLSTDPEALSVQPSLHDAVTSTPLRLSTRCGDRELTFRPGMMMSGRNATYAVPEFSRSGALAACAPRRRSGCLSPFMSPTPETDQPVRSSAAAPSSRNPRSPSFARSIFAADACRRPRTPSRVGAAVLVGLLRADDDVRPAVTVEVSACRRRSSRRSRTRRRRRFGSLRREALARSTLPAPRPKTTYAEPESSRRLASAAVAPMRTSARPSPLTSPGPATDQPTPPKTISPLDIPVDLEAALSESCKVDGLRRALPEDH